MVHYGLAVMLLVSALASVQGFSSRSSLLVSSRSVEKKEPLRRELSATTYFSDDENNEEKRKNFREDVNRLGADVNKIGSEYMESISKALTDDEVDAYEAEVAERRRIVLDRNRAEYEVTLPVTQTLGVTLCQVDQQEFSDFDLNLDSLQFQAPPASASDATEDGDLVTMDPSEVKGRLREKFRGVVISSVVKGGQGWNEGLRPGDVLLSTSATLGQALWPKSTLEGVQSAVASRKMSSGTMTFRFERSTEEVANQYELTLTKPLGIEVKETEDGFVEVTGFNANARKLVRYAINVGDRILAVDSAIGDRLWPVSTVEGVISACTSRLPGQPIRMRFARPVVEETDGVKTMAPIRSATAEKKAVVADSTSGKQLLAQCRQVLKRYSAEEQRKESVGFVDKYAVPALVAVKVLDAVASASLSLDAVTLSMVMNAYLACRQPEDAIRTFEAAVGLKADGSSAPATETIQGKEKGSLVPSENALNLVSASSLMRAHSLRGDTASVERVLAALEGRSGVDVAGIESAEWPNTGISGSIVPDTQCYNIALSAAAKSGRTDAALSLFNRMSEPRVSGNKPSKDVITYNTIICALAKAGRADEAFAIFDNMKRSNVRPDKYTYTSLIKACVREGDIQELLFDMKEQGVKPDVVMYNTMIRSLCNRYRWYEAKELVTEMEGLGISPDSMTYGLLMRGLLKANKPSTCLTLFEAACADRRTASLAENVHLYTTAIAASSAIGNHERALDLVARMNAAGVKPNLKTMTALMSACLSSGKNDLAVDVFGRLDKPDGYAMMIGIRAMCAKGDLAAASELLSEQRSGRKAMSGKQVMKSFDVVIRSSLEQGDHAVARQAFADLLKSGYIPSKSLLQTILYALDLGPKKRKKGLTAEIRKEIPNENFDFLLYILDALRGRNLPVDGSFYSSVLYNGASIGGLRRKVASLLAESRTATVDANIGDMSGAIVEREEANGRIVVRWADLVQNYDEYKNQLGYGVELPPLSVRIAAKEVRQVLAAERRVSFDTDQLTTRRRQLV